VATYNSDFAAWLEEQAAALRTRSVNALDWDNLAEEIEGVSASQRKELRSRLKILCQHLLKWEYQPEHRSRSWRSSIFTQRDEINETLDDSPSLRAYPPTVLARVYATARVRAADETGLLQLPATCPWTIEQVLDQNFLPP
jgi:hypothetical protein